MIKDKYDENWAVKQVSFLNQKNLKQTVFLDKANKGVLKILCFDAWDNHKFIDVYILSVTSARNLLYRNYDFVASGYNIKSENIAEINWDTEDDWIKQIHKFPKDALELYECHAMVHADGFHAIEYLDNKNIKGFDTIFKYILKHGNNE